MSQVKLTLRPPPNVDFVHGYPGIPPGGPERPQAAVKGAIEVRCPQGVKAKWLRIELRKVETLPAGGMLSTFYDFVGPSPVNLWTSSDEFDLLRTQDFPFSIRIPESIPPSVMLENRAGIQYELVASLCTKGKKNFFRKRKSVVVSTQAAIIIDKHELHSTWPVYNQAETRHIAASGCTLLVDRAQTCYGPGDRIVVVATLRSDSAMGPVLRGFELMLRETTIFSTGPHGHAVAATGGGAGGGGAFGSRSRGGEAPGPRTVTICESKLAVNAPLTVGAVHRAELSCSLSGNHTTTTLNAARHIDVTYLVCVRAVLDGDGVHPVLLDLPVVISNWQRNVSEVAIKRIGPAPGLSLIPIPSSTSGTIRNPAPAPTTTTPPSTLTLPSRNPSATSNPTYNTAPSKTITGLKSDELGYGVGAGLGYTTSLASTTTNTNTGAKPAHHRNPSAGSANEARPTTGGGRRPNSSSGREGARLTVVNALPSEIAEDAEDERGGGAGGPQQQTYLTAHNEKLLYEAARARADRMQGYAEPQESPPHSQSQPPSHPNTNTNNQRESAEDEKRRYERARQAALGTQGVQAYTGPSPPPNANSNNVSVNHAAATPEKKLGVALYTQAIAARNQSLAQQQQQEGGDLNRAASPNRNESLNTTLKRNESYSSARPQYPGAEEEKEALKRYEQARLARDRVQNAGGNVDGSGAGGGGSAPIAYEHLYPGGGVGTGGSSGAPNDLPPPFEGGAGGGGGGSGGPLSAYEEKERLRRQYEQQDATAAAAALSRANTYTNPPSPRAATSTPLSPRTNTYTSPPSPRTNMYPSPPSPRAATNGTLPPPSFTYREPVGAEQIKKALSEKEILRRKYEAEEAAAQQQQYHQQLHQHQQQQEQQRQATPPRPPPPRSGSVSSSTSGTAGSVRGATTTTTRPQPAVPVQGGKVLTAAEEKAQLKAQWAAQDARTLGTQHHQHHHQQPQQQPSHVNGETYSPGRPSSSSVPPLQPQQLSQQKNTSAPPLKPRPPVEYIQETQEEDARVSRAMAMGAFVPVVEDLPPPPLSYAVRTPSPLKRAGGGGGGGGSIGSLDVRPFSPFNAGLGLGAGVNGA